MLSPELGVAPARRRSMSPVLRRVSSSLTNRYAPTARNPASPQQQTAPTGSSIPGAGIYLQQQAMAEQAYQTALAQIQQRRQGILKDYGFLESGEVDPHNQYGAVQRMFKGQALEAEQADVAARSRGFAGVGGLAGRQIAQQRDEQGFQRFELQKGYENNLADLAQAKWAAEQERNQRMLDIQQQALYDAMQNDQYQEAEPYDEEEPAQLPTRGQVRATVRRVAKKPAKKKGKRR